MRHWRMRWSVFAGVLFLGFFRADAAETPVRASPTRPGQATGALETSAPPAPAAKSVPPPAKVKKTESTPRFPAPEWVDIEVAAKRLGLKLE